MLKQLARLLIEVPTACQPELSLPRSHAGLCVRWSPDSYLATKMLL